MDHLLNTLTFTEEELVATLRKHWLLAYRAGGVLRGLFCIHLPGQGALEAQVRILGQQFEYSGYTSQWIPQSQRLIELDLQLQQLSTEAKNAGEMDSATHLALAPRLILEFNRLSQDIRDDLVINQNSQIRFSP